MGKVSSSRNIFLITPSLYYYAFSVNISIFQEEGEDCLAAGAVTPSGNRVKPESGWDLLPAPTLPGPGDPHTASVRMQGEDQQ